LSYSFTPGGARLHTLKVAKRISCCIIETLYSSV
jgi:hypothetical protein